MGVVEFHHIQNGRGEKVKSIEVLIIEVGGMLMIGIEGMLVVGVVVEMLEDVNDNDILQILMRNLLVTEGVCIEIENKHDVSIEM